MGRRLAHGLALSLASIIVACAGDDEPTTSTFSSSSPSATTRGAETNADRSCASRGACDIDGAECRFETSAGLQACRENPDASFVAAKPNEWRCTCADAHWRCEITSGGFGMIECP